MGGGEPKSRATKECSALENDLSVARSVSPLPPALSFRLSSLFLFHALSFVASTPIN